MSGVIGVIVGGTIALLAGAALGWNAGFDDGWDSALDSVKKMVVRCKDCKFYHRMTAETGICKLACRHLGNDGFCSEGERKDGDHAEGSV